MGTAWGLHRKGSFVYRPPPIIFSGVALYVGGPFAMLAGVEQPPSTLAIIAGSGTYPLAMARSARAAGVSRLVAAAFENETSQEMARLVDEIEWMRVGQLGRMLNFLKRTGARAAVMSGQIAPKNL